MISSLCLILQRALSLARSLALSRSRSLSLVAVCAFSMDFSCSVVCLSVYLMLFRLVFARWLILPLGKNKDTFSFSLVFFSFFLSLSTLSLSQLPLCY
jgi:hypothetical protein